MYVYYIISAVCGISIAATEIATRYRDDPGKAIFCRFGIAYTVFNSILSILALVILQVFGNISLEQLTRDNFYYSLIAGFGAVIVMRSNLISIGLDNHEEKKFGPSIVIDTVLVILDRQIDRQRAFRRGKIIRECMQGIDYNKACQPMVNMLTRSMQRLTPEEIKKLGEEIAKLDSSPLDNQQRANSLGFLMLNYAGEGYFKLFEPNERKKYLLNQ